MAKTRRCTTSPRWQRAGKKLLDVIEPDVPRKRALELAVTIGARLRFVLCDDFTFERARGTARHAHVLDAAKHLEKELRAELAVKHGYSGGGEPALSSPSRFTSAAAVKAIEHVLFRKSDYRSWAYFHSGDDAEVTPEWGLIVQDQALEVFGPPSKLVEVTELFDECLRVLGGYFVWGYVGIDAVGWPAVAHLRRADTVIRNLLGVALQTTERAAAKERAFAAVAIGAHGFVDGAGEASARAVLAGLGKVDESNGALVARSGVRSADAAAIKRSGLATKALTALMAKLRKRRMGRRGSAVRELPIFESLAAIDAAARSTTRRARKR